MKVTIDSGEPLERVLPVINALYGVSLSLPNAPTAATAGTGSARRSRSAKTGSRQSPERRNKRTAPSAGAVREWARAKGYEVSSRGRISAELVEAYRSAQ